VGIGVVIIRPTCAADKTAGMAQVSRHILCCASPISRPLHRVNRVPCNERGPSTLAAGTQSRDSFHCTAHIDLGAIKTNSLDRKLRKCGT